jgi:hypothetical protein
MNKTKMVLCALLAVMLIIPLAITIAPAVRADSGEPPAPTVKADSAEPQGGAEVVALEYWHCPIMLPWTSPYTGVVTSGFYYAKGKWKIYDWEGNKVPLPNDAIIAIPCQPMVSGFCDHKVEVYVIPTWILEPGMPQIGILPPKEIIQQIMSGKFPPSCMPVPPGENATPPQTEEQPGDIATPPQPEKQPGYACPYLGPYNGYVGLTKRDTVKYKIKNKPRLSALYFTGTYGNYADPFWTCTLNAEIKVDTKDWHDRIPKSMKGIVVGWSQSPPPLTIYDSSPSWAQFEFKFTAKPIPVD